MRRTLSGRFGIAAERVARLEAALREHFPEAWVEGFEHRIPAMTSDATDRRVLAAAVHARADFLVTYNLRHFPPAATIGWGVAAAGPGAFLKQLYRAAPDDVLQVLHQQAADLHRDLPAQLRTLGKAVPAFVELICQDRRIRL